MKGVGLGLSVSYGIIKDHGGEIRWKVKRGRARPSRSAYLYKGKPPTLSLSFDFHHDGLVVPERPGTHIGLFIVNFFNGRKAHKKEEFWAIIS